MAISKRNRYGVPSTIAIGRALAPADEALVGMAGDAVARASTPAPAHRKRGQSVLTPHFGRRERERAAR